jgi:hypothetical protein
VQSPEFSNASVGIISVMVPMPEPCHNDITTFQVIHRRLEREVHELKTKKYIAVVNIGQYHWQLVGHTGAGDATVIEP